VRSSPGSVPPSCRSRRSTSSLLPGRHPGT